MSLEARIELLTSAIIELTAAIGGMQAPASVIDNSPAGVLRSNEEYYRKEAEETPNEQSKSTPDTSQTSVEESAKVVYNDVAKLVTQIAKSDLAKAKATLARLGVKHGKELSEAQWPEAVSYLTRVAAGEVDPEASHE